MGIPALDETERLVDVWVSNQSVHCEAKGS